MRYCRSSQLVSLSNALWNHASECEAEGDSAAACLVFAACHHVLSAAKEPILAAAALGRAEAIAENHPEAFEESGVVSCAVAAEDCPESELF